MQQGKSGARHSRAVPKEKESEGGPAPRRAARDVRPGQRRRTTAGDPEAPQAAKQGQGPPARGSGGTEPPQAGPAPRRRGTGKHGQERPAPRQPERARYQPTRILPYLPYITYDKLSGYVL